MSDDNYFISLAELPKGRVAVKVRRNPFNEDGLYGKVVQHTHTAQNLLNSVAEKLPSLDTGTILSVLNAYADAVCETIAAGNAASFGDIGVFSISGKGSLSSEKEKPELTVHFTPGKKLKEAVKNVEIATTELSVPKGTITNITDGTQGVSNGTLTSGGMVFLKGRNIKVGGEKAGIWFAPAVNGVHTSDESEWVPVDTALVINQPSQLLFTLPASVKSGSYKIIVRTRYAERASYERAYLIETVSDCVTIV